MKPSKIYDLIKSSVYTKSGDDVDWTTLVDHEEKKVYLLFQQSVSKRDWQNNFNFPVKLYKNQQSCLKVARGWGDAYKSCNDDIMRILITRHNDNPDYEVYICGWSYGGAMAVIASEDFYFRTGIKPHLVTFGAPKPLFGKDTLSYVKSCLADAVQYAHRNDLVTVLPPFIGYRHVNKVELGKFDLFKIFKVVDFHRGYRNEDWYER